jgi:hypothetical protein
MDLERLKDFFTAKFHLVDNIKLHMAKQETWSREQFIELKGCFSDLS